MYIVKYRYFWAGATINTYKGAVYENIVGDMLVKQGYPLYFIRIRRGR